MMQKYIVFSTDKAVIIQSGKNTGCEQPGEMCSRYTGKAALAEAVRIFESNPDKNILTFFADDRYSEAVQAFNSLFTPIKAAGGLVRNPEGEWLFIRRFDRWDLPKGKAEEGETPEITALREVEEETGLGDLEIRRKLPSTYHLYTDRHGVKLLKETYWFEMLLRTPGTPVPQTGEAITEVKWFAPAELAVPVNDTYASLRRMILDFCISENLLLPGMQPEVS
jgi:8-oxo-dGTP pyrophosphatase MutT (NUDIX family)